MHSGMGEDFSDSALVLLGHGSTLNVDSARPTYQHADALRARNLFAQVEEAFWKLEPGVSAVLRGTFAKRVFVVPLFISEGYFTEEVLPRELGFAQRVDGSFETIRHDGGQTIHYCGPIGTHESMTGALVARAKDIVERHPFPSLPRTENTTLFIAGHGASNNENSRKAIEDQAERIRDNGEYAEVQAVFMEEEPRVEACYELAKTKNIVMVPFFISDGLHSFEDIPVMLGETEKRVHERLKNGQPTWVNPTERRGKRLWYTASIGTEPFIAEVILERVREAAAR